MTFRVRQRVSRSPPSSELYGSTNGAIRRMAAVVEWRA